ncbi:MAG: cytochrome c-type biogenesis CcmF C-terminal domain-containing protein, partial [Oceanospirillum sp.]|nr:cytochrome c-type biogenesis CcmF C-terminal domain-containing protein [Oceanospirillum sp.]
GDAWAMRVQHKPYVRWLWIGGVVMTLGGMLAAMDKRYRRMAAREVKAKQNADSAGSQPVKNSDSSAEGASA